MEAFNCSDKTEDDVKNGLLIGWSTLLDILNYWNTTVYLYTYDTSRSITKNGASFSEKLGNLPGWKDGRDCPITFIAHSMGGLVTPVALDDAFNLDNDLPANLNIITLGTPFRGTPWASKTFQCSLNFKALVDFVDAAMPYLDPTFTVGKAKESLACFISSYIIMLFSWPAGAQEVNELWPIAKKKGLAPRLTPVAGDISALPLSRPGLYGSALFIGQSILSTDPNYAKSDGFIPLYSALRRATEFDNSPPTGGELVFQDDHIYLSQDPIVFANIGFYPSVLTNSLVYIPPGSFLMGSSNPERGNWEGPQHQVSLTKGFYMGATEVTQKQYLDVMGTNPSYFNGSGFGVDLTRPVEHVSFIDVALFCNRCSVVEGLRPCYNDLVTLDCDFTADGYRLPTEAEWEYTCRAGTTTRFSFGDALNTTLCPNDQCVACPEADAYIWWCGNSSGQTHSVGTKKANPWGLYDMQGNVDELCQDWISTYPATAETNPVVVAPLPNWGNYRVVRGGDLTNDLLHCRSADRDWSDDRKYNTVGFRVVRMVPGK